MNRRRAPALLTPMLAGVLLAGFALSGLMTGVLTHGLVASLTAGVPTVGPSTSRTPVPGLPTSTATVMPLVPGVPFALTLTAVPSHVRDGQTLTLVVMATVNGTATPVANLLCTLRAPESGPAPLLASWPAPQTTNAQGRAMWQITVPQQPRGKYGVEVSASGTHSFRTWRVAWIYVIG